MAERIKTAVVNTGSAVHRHVSDTSGDLRRFADTMVANDARHRLAFHRIERANPPRFTGREELGDGIYRTHEFTPDKILSAPIRDPERNVVGVNFPSNEHDSKLSLRFTPEAYEAVHREYRQGLKIDAEKEGDPPIWKLGKRIRAPWAKKEQLVFAKAHGNRDGYDIKIKVRSPGKIRARWITVGIDGPTHGLILASNKHFKDAVKNKPTATLIRWDCSTAAGSAAPLSAQSLHSAGILFDSWATREIHLTTFREEFGGRTILGHGSLMKVDEHGNPTESPWGVNRAPRIPPDTPD
ncbi:hypothetical protein [Nocardia sp. NPDC051463]|uniref:hypothetical protein n=1 Tax=Nocardia sp. NPDC051463 TaxID=3154845 RepID=UPI00344DB66A